MFKLLENIGLGLFMNGSYAMLNGDFSANATIVTIGAFCIMAFAVYCQRRLQ